MTQPDAIPMLPGEEIASSALRSARAASEVSDDAINEKYARGDVRIVIEQARYPLRQVSELVQSADYDLQPDFQRRPRWSREQQSRLIESFIMNVPVPPIFLYEADYSRYEVMDGRQRLTAISQFYSGDFVLTGLTEWPELNGRSYEKLPEQVRRGIDRRYLSSIVLLHETAKSSDQADKLKQLVFERINTGGEDLSPQEKRNAILQGPLNRLCIELSRTPSLCRMWDIPEPTTGERLGDESWQPPEELSSNPAFKRMEDVELVLRFFAHRQRRVLWRSGMRLEDYLNSYLKAGNQFPRSTIDALGGLFTETSDLAYEVLGERAFYLFRERRGAWSWVARPTVVAFDSLMFTFSQLLDQGDTLRAQSGVIRASLEDFYRENYAKFDGRKVNPSDILARDSAALGFLARFCTD